MQVPEPTIDETIEILRGPRERYEIHHKHRYTDEALIVAAKLSYQCIRYVNYNKKNISHASAENVTPQRKLCWNFTFHL